jgi:hypothetical protein
VPSIQVEEPAAADEAPEAPEALHDPASEANADADADAETDPGSDDAADGDGHRAPANDLDLPEVKARVQYLSYNESINFDEQGNEQHRNSNFSVNVRLRLEGGDDAASFKSAVIESAVTSAGERLTVPQHHNHWRNHHPFPQQHHGRMQQEHHANAQLSVPTLAAEQIDELRGHVELSVTRGEVKQALLRPISLYDGKTVRVIGIEGMRVRVKRMPMHHTLRLELPMGVNPLEHVTFLGDANGVLPAPQPRSSGSSGEWAHQDYQVALPDDGGVLLRWRESSDVVKVPFVVHDIPLPGQRGAAVELSVVAEPMRDLANPLTGLDLMEVEVVEEN